MDGPELIGDNMDALALGVVPFDLGCETPVIQFGDFESGSLIDMVHSLQEGGKPGGERVRDGVSQDLGLGVEFMGVNGLLRISERPLHVRRARNETDEGNLGGLPINIVVTTSISSCLLNCNDSCVTDAVQLLM